MAEFEHKEKRNKKEGDGRKNNRLVRVISSAELLKRIDSAGCFRQKLREF